jgi:hypothetical protein
MSKESWYDGMYGERLTPEQFNVPMQYSVSFEWGGLHVSEAAHNRYGFVPLTANLEPGLLQRDETEPPHTHIYLVAPGELDVPDEIESGKVIIRTGTDREGIDICVALGDDKNTAVKVVIDKEVDRIQQETGLDPSVILQRAVDKDQVPIEESIQNNINQFLLPIMCGALETFIAEAAEDGLLIELHREFYQKVKKLGLGVVTLMDVVLVGTWAQDAFRLPLLAIAEGSLLTANFIAFGAAMKQHLTMDPKFRRVAHQVANGYAHQVAQDVYCVFSREHFDQQLAENFSPDSE